MLEWGEPPRDYLERQEGERKELEKLERQGYTVIRMWQVYLPP
jgi:hypothetical protein